MPDPQGMSPAGEVQNWKTERQVSHKLCNFKLSGKRKPGSTVVTSFLGAPFDSFLDRFGSGAVCTGRGEEPGWSPRTFAGLRILQVESAGTHSISLSVSPGHGGFLPCLRQWKLVSQLRADMWSLGIWQIRTRSDPRHLLQLVYSLKQRASSLSLSWESKDAVGSLLLGGATLSDVGDGTSAAALPPLKMKFSDHETRSRKMHFLWLVVNVIVLKWQLLLKYMFCPENTKKYKDKKSSWHHTKNGLPQLTSIQYFIRSLRIGLNFKEYCLR